MEREVEPLEAAGTTGGLGPFKPGQKPLYSAQMGVELFSGAIVP